jgi:hypothetical protein
MSNITDNQQYLTVKQFCEENNLTNGVVRYWILNKEKNGFDKCIYRIGKKIFIRQDKFEQLMGSNPDNLASIQEDQKLAVLSLIERAIAINQKILTLSDLEIGNLFEDYSRDSIKFQRHLTFGIINALEEIQNEKDFEKSIINLESMVEERCGDNTEKYKEWFDNLPTTLEEKTIETEATEKLLKTTKEEASLRGMKII